MIRGRGAPPSISAGNPLPPASGFAQRFGGAVPLLSGGAHRTRLGSAVVSAPILSHGLAGLVGETVPWLRGGARYYRRLPSAVTGAAVRGLRRTAHVVAANPLIDGGAAVVGARIISLCPLAHIVSADGDGGAAGVSGFRTERIRPIGAKFSSHSIACAFVVAIPFGTRCTHGAGRRTIASSARRGAPASTVPGAIRRSGARGKRGETAARTRGHVARSITTRSA